jgi:uncharacterized circularly permuted ATP-grasp superfamily protein
VNFSRLRPVAFVWIFATFFSFHSFAEPSNYYNEVFYPDGSLREKYAGAFPFVKEMSKTAYNRQIRESKKLMSGDTPMGPMPRLLYEEEFHFLKRGVEQREKAIRAFLNDHYSGKQTYRDKVIPGKIIDQIIARTGEAALFEPIKKSTKDGKGNFRFLYGPDIIRGPDGVFYVLEDNLGFVGGTPGDTIPSREVFEGTMPKLAKALDIKNDPRDFLTEVIDKNLATANPKIGFHKGEGAFVMLSSPPYGDKEDTRMAEQMAKRGVLLVTPHTRRKKLIVKDDGVYLQEKTKFKGESETKVGMLWLNAEHSWIDWKDPSLSEKAMIEEARSYLEESSLKPTTRKIIQAALETDLRTSRVNPKNLEAALKHAIANDFAWVPSVITNRSPYPGLQQAILDGRVQSNYSPGTEFVGDKMFHTYMEDIIRHYLGEEPILRNPPTERFFDMRKDGSLVMNHKRLKDTIDAMQAERVLKVVDGRGGTGIHIGPKMKESDWKGLEKTISPEMLRYISQKYTHPSVVSDGHNDWIVDIRMFSYADENGALVSESPWGRSNLLSGDGLVNMSKHGTLSLNLVVKSCSRALEKMNNLTTGDKNIVKLSKSQ